MPRAAKEKSWRAGVLLAALLAGLVGGASSAEASIPREEPQVLLEQPVPLLEQSPLLEVPADEPAVAVSAAGGSLPLFAPGRGPDGLFDGVRIPALERFQAETRYRVIELEIEIRTELEQLQTFERAGFALFGGGKSRRGSPNRYYDPELGRFISADPLGYVDGPSMYGFAGYSPMNFGDPLGLCFAGVTCREWLGEIFSGEGMKRSGRFLKGEVTGAGHAVKVTAQGAYQFVRHPIQTTQTVVEGAVEGSASLVVNADRVPAQLAEAGRALRDASPEEQGKVTGEVLAGVLMGGAAGRGAKAVKSLFDFSDLADAGMVGFREGLTPRFQVPRRTTLVGGGARLENLSKGQRSTIQQFATENNVQVTVVGSRAARPGGRSFESDFDYIIEPFNSKIRKRAKRQLPRGQGGGELGPRRPSGRDFLGGPVRTDEPFITFLPEGQ